MSDLTKELMTERNAARAHASHWRREVGALVGLQSEGTPDSTLLKRLQQTIADGSAAQALADDRQEETEAAYDALRRIAVAAGMDGAPTRYNVDQLVERVTELRESAGTKPGARWARRWFPVRGKS